MHPKKKAKFPIPLCTWGLTAPRKGSGCPLVPFPYPGCSGRNSGIHPRIGPRGEAVLKGATSAAVLAEGNGENLIFASSYCNELTSHKRKKKSKSRCMGIILSGA